METINEQVDKMKQRINYKTIELFIICSVIMLCLSGCGQKIALRIQDGYTETQLEISSGKTVKEILKLAEIDLDERDQITPALDAQVNEDDTEIVISRYAEVEIHDGKQSYNVKLTGKKVEDALKEANVTMDNNDTMNHNLDAFLVNGMSISVIKRFDISATINGDTEQYLTEAKTVKDFLDSQGIVIGKNDIITPKLSSKLKEGMKVVVKKTDIKKEVRTEEIPFSTTVTYSDSMDEGTSKVTQEGVNGKKKVTYRVTYIDGKKDKEIVMKEKVIKEPTDQVITKGTKKKVETKNGKQVVSREKVYDCDGSGHGYYIITYEDGTVEYEDF